MRKFLTLAAMTMPVLILTACASQDPAGNLQSNQPPTASETKSPPAKPTLGNVSQTLLADHRGKIVIVNFFATWCPPCIQEIKEFKTDLWPKIKSNSDVVLLSIAEDDNRADVERWLKREKLGWTFLWDKGGALFSQHTQDGTIPLLIVIDKTGKIAATQTGFAPGLAEALLKHLNQLGA